MAEIVVTFKIEGDDPDHPMGISEAAFLELNDQLAQLGAYDIEIEDA